MDAAAAQAALIRDVGAPWGGPDCGAAEAAEAVVAVVDENMAAAARAHASEWGKDIAERTLIAFGGGAPLHAARLMEKLGLRQVLVPPAAGVGSAVGFLAAPVSYEVVRSRYMRLSGFDSEAVDQVMTEMRAEAREVVGAIVDDAGRETRQAHMRYLGQGYEIAVDVAQPTTAEALRGAFDRAYEALYGRLIPGLDVEVLSWTLTLCAEVAELASPPPSSASRCAAHVVSGRVERSALTTGAVVAGPANIVEDETVIVVPTGCVARVDDQGNVLISRQA